MHGGVKVSDVDNVWDGWMENGLDLGISLLMHSVWLIPAYSGPCIQKYSRVKNSTTVYEKRCFVKDYETWRVS